MIRDNVWLLLWVCWLLTFSLLAELCPWAAAAFGCVSVVVALVLWRADR